MHTTKMLHFSLLAPVITIIGTVVIFLLGIFLGFRMLGL